MKRIVLGFAGLLVGCTAEMGPVEEAPAPAPEVKVEAETSVDLQSRAARCRLFLHKCMAQPNPHDAYCLSWMENC